VGATLEVGMDADECDSEQLKWLEFLHGEDPHMRGASLLEAMSMVGTESEDAWEPLEEGRS
jgi:hypothetical protein